MNIVDLGSYTSGLYTNAFKKATKQARTCSFSPECMNTSQFLWHLKSNSWGCISKGLLRENLYLLLLRCIVARRKETTQLLKCYSGMCLGVLVPHCCLKRAAICSVLAKQSAFGTSRNRILSMLHCALTHVWPKASHSQFQPVFSLQPSTCTPEAALWIQLCLVSQPWFLAALHCALWTIFLSQSLRQWLFSMSESYWFSSVSSCCRPVAFVSSSALAFPPPPHPPASFLDC